MKYKCTNCDYTGENLSRYPLRGKCPMCGDEVISLTTNKVTHTKEVKVNLDLNGDGKVDEKDASLASKVLNTFKKRKVKRKNNSKR